MLDSPEDSASKKQPSAWSQYLSARVSLFKLEWEEIKHRLVLKVLALVFILLSLIGLVMLYFGAVESGCAWLSTFLLGQVESLDATARLILTPALPYLLMALWHGSVAFIAWKAVLTKKEVVFESSIEELESDLIWVKNKLNLDKKK